MRFTSFPELSIWLLHHLVCYLYRKDLQAKHSPITVSLPAASRWGATSWRHWGAAPSACYLGYGLFVHLGALQLFTLTADTADAGMIRPDKRQHPDRSTTTRWQQWGSYGGGARAIYLLPTSIVLKSSVEWQTKIPLCQIQIPTI